MPGSLFPCLSDTAMAMRLTLLYIWKKAWLIDVLYGIQIEQKLLQKIIQVLLNNLFANFRLKNISIHKLIMTGDSITDECPCVVPSTSAVHHYLHLRYEQPEPRLTVQSIIGILVRRMMLSWAGSMYMQGVGREHVHAGSAEGLLHPGGIDCGGGDCVNLVLIRNDTGGFLWLREAFFCYLPWI